MTDEELAEIEARADAATKGRWYMSMAGFVHSDYAKAGRPLIADCSETSLKLEQQKANAQFIAHARRDVPALIAEVRELRRQIAEAQVSVSGR